MVKWQPLTSSLPFNDEESNCLKQKKPLLQRGSTQPKCVEDMRCLLYQCGRERQVPTFLAQGTVPGDSSPALSRSAYLKTRTLPSSPPFFRDIEIPSQIPFTLRL